MSTVSRVIRASVPMVMVRRRLYAQRDAGRRMDRIRRKHRHGGRERLSHFEADVDNDRHGFLTFTLHEAASLAAHDHEQNLEEFLALSELSDAQEPRGDAATYLVVLLEISREIDEEATAHVRLQFFHLTALGRFEPVHQQSAVFQEPASADFLRVLGVD